MNEDKKMKEHEDSSFESKLRDRVKNLDYEYQPEDWARLEKDLPPKAPSAPSVIKSSLWPWAATVVFLAGMIATILYINRPEGSSITTPLVENADFNQESIQPKAIDDSISTPVVTQEQDEPLRQESVSRTESVAAAPASDGDTTTPPSPSAEKSLSSASHEAKPIEEPEADQEIEKTAPKPPDARFSLSLASGCAPLYLNVYPIEQADSIRYRWETSDGQISKQILPEFHFQEPGEYTIKLVLSYPISGLTAEYELSTPIEVYPTPTAEFTVLRDEFYYSFTPQEVKEAHQFTWFIHGDKREGLYQMEEQLVRNGLYLVSLQVSNAFGCESESSDTIEVRIIHPIYMGNAFTPDGDGENDVFGPLADYLQEMEYLLEIYSRNGGLVFRSQDPNEHWNGFVQSTQQPASEGFYIWKIYTEDRYGNRQERAGDVFLFRHQ